MMILIAGPYICKERPYYFVMCLFLPAVLPNFQINLNYL